MRTKSLITACLVAGGLAMTMNAAQAAQVTFNLDTVFSTGAVAPDGFGPYAKVVLDDGGTAGSVTMTISLAADIGSANLSQLYLNYDSALVATDNQLFAFDTNSTGPDADNGQGQNGIFTGGQYQADGDGIYDMYFDFPPPPGNGTANSFDANEWVKYTITLPGVTASSFNLLSLTGGGEGPFYAAAHFQTTGPGGKDSAWIGAVEPIVVPAPAAVWLFGTGLLGLVGIARRKSV